MDNIPVHDGLEAVDDLISDIHQLIDEKPEPTPEQVAEELQLPEELFAEEAPAEDPAQAPAGEAPAEPPAEAPAQEPPVQETEQPQDFQQQRWTERQKVPKHVAKLQQNQQEAYEQWLREQEEKGEEPPPEFPEEKPKKKRLFEDVPEEETEPEVALPKQKKGRTCLVICIIMLVLALTAAAVTALVLPTRPMADSSSLHADGAAAILLAGTDDTLARTDMLMLMLMDTGKGELSLVSLPRDTLVVYEDSPVSLGSVYARAGGGEDGITALTTAVRDCVGFVPDGCLVLYPEAVVQFMDALGENGEDALRKLRLRDESEELDLSRADTQRQFLAELIHRCGNVGTALKAPGLLDKLCANSVTDLTQRELLWLARGALFVDAAHTAMAVLPGSIQDGSYVLDPEAVVQTVNGTCNPYVRAVEAEDLHIAQPDA